MFRDMYAADVDHVAIDMRRTSPEVAEPGRRQKVEGLVAAVDRLETGLGAEAFQR